MRASRLLAALKPLFSAQQFRHSSASVAQLYDDHLQLQIPSTRPAPEGNPQQQRLLSFPYSFLRDHCRCPLCYNHSTRQRRFDLHSLRPNLRPRAVFTDGDQLVIDWSDGHQGHFPLEWLGEKQSKATLRQPWDKTTWLTARQLPSVTVDQFHTDAGLDQHLLNLLTYGVSLITGATPTPEATQQLCHRVCSPQETIFGTYWTFTGGVVDHQDTAYSFEALGAHTDGTYYQSTPGYQVFHCIEHSSAKGGETLLVDGLHCVNQLKAKNPEAFQFLSTKAIPHEYVDDEHHLNTELPVIQLDDRGRLAQLRYNMYDRGPLLNLGHEDIGRFYAAYRSLTDEVRDENNETWLKLSPGTVLFIDNWRVLHGRSAFQGRRVITGCYLSRDHFYSHARVRKLFL